jgi:hypothetical protein
MSEASAPPPQRQDVQPTGMTAWVGLVAFGGAMLLLLGMFHIVEGLMALFRDDYFQVPSSQLTVHVDWTVWGITHMAAGVAMIAAGIGLFTGQTWARVAAVLLCMISAIVSLGFVQADPVWSTLMIALDTLVIWAVIMHGGELKEE